MTNEECINFLLFANVLTFMGFLFVALQTYCMFKMICCLKEMIDAQDEEIKELREAFPIMNR